MKGFCSGFKKDPMGTLAAWQDTREPWLLFAFTSILLVLLAHYLFQNWLHMLPCEQCVYIRYGNIVMAIGAFIVAIKPKVIWSKIVGIGIFLYGLIYTMMCSLPLDKWWPDWFKQTGDCGYDAPVVPAGTELGDFQRWLIEVYQASDGWYLFPQWKFMDMAECCMLACVCYAILLAALLFAWIKRDFLK